MIGQMNLRYNQIQIQDFRPIVDIFREIHIWNTLQKNIKNSKGNQQTIDDLETLGSWSILSKISPFTKQLH